MIINTCLEILSRTFEYIAAHRTSASPAIDACQKADKCPGGVRRIGWFESKDADS